MKTYAIFCLAFLALPLLGGCNSATPVASANLATGATLQSPEKYDYKKLGGIHANHTPEQHAAFLKRVGQWQTGDEDALAGGIGGGGGGHHH